MLNPRCAFSILLLAFIGVAGSIQTASAADEVAKLQGKVTVDGQPLANGRIFIHLKGGQFVGSKIEADGSYEIDRVPTGLHTVTVEWIRNGKSLLPPKYSEGEKSQLRTTIRKGGNVLDLKLRSGGS